MAQALQFFKPFIAFTAVLLFATQALADSNIPLPLQGAILAKALNYDQTVREQKGKPKVVIVAGGSQKGEAGALAQAFKTLGGPVVVTSPGDLDSNIRGASALYAFPGLVSETVRSLCVQHKVISMSGQKNDALSGRVSMSLGVAEGKPQIIVHLPRSKAEGHKLSSRLLKLAKVVQ